MWHFISEQISQSIGEDFICNDVRDIPEGDSHQAFRISDGKRRFFVKTNEKNQIENFNAEADGLAHLAQAQLFKVPKVVTQGIVSDRSFLVLEFIHLTQGDSAHWHQFGKNLALLHQQHSQQMYGWQEDNYIGRSVQINQWHKKWSVFFAEQRIGYMLQMLAEQGNTLANIDKVVSSVETILAGHAPQASMLHGDLWKGNTGFFKGQAVIYDPAFYYGDRETDIAMTELFGRFPEQFYQAYNAQWPLDAEYEYRKPIYQLYHTLNHALTFGGYYIDSAKQVLKNLDS